MRPKIIDPVTGMSAVEYSRLRGYHIARRLQRIQTSRAIPSKCEARRIAPAKRANIVPSQLQTQYLRDRFQAQINWMTGLAR